MTTAAEDGDTGGCGDLRNRFMHLDGTDPTVRIILGLDRLLLAPKIRAHPKSADAQLRLDVDTMKGRRLILNVAFGLAMTSRAATSALNRWTNEYTKGTPEERIRRGLHNLRINYADGDAGTKSAMGNLTAFAMNHGKWAEGMARIVEEAEDDTVHGTKRTAIIARMVSTVFGRQSRRWTDNTSRAFTEDVCSGMILDMYPFSGWGMASALTAMGMDLPADVGRVASMIGLLADGVPDDMRLAVMTRPTAGRDDAPTADGIMAFRDRVKSVMDDAGAMNQGLQDFSMCDWRVLDAIANGSLPPRMIDPIMLDDQRDATDGSPASKDVARIRDRMLTCDRMTRIDFSNPDPRRMMSILKALVPTTTPGDNVVEDLVACDTYRDRRVIEHGDKFGGGEIIYQCLTRGDIQGLVAMNALWDLFHAVLSPMIHQDAGSGRVKGFGSVFNWPILTGSAVSSAIWDFASRSLPAGFIGETLSAAPCGEGKVCTLEVHVSGIRGINGGYATNHYIGIDWSR